MLPGSSSAPTTTDLQQCTQISINQWPLQLPSCTQREIRLHTQLQVNQTSVAIMNYFVYITITTQKSYNINYTSVEHLIL